MAIKLEIMWVDQSVEELPIDLVDGFSDPEFVKQLEDATQEQQYECGQAIS